MIMPQTPAIPKNVSAKSKAAATKATVLEVIRSEFRLNLLTKLLFKKTKRRHTKYIYAKQKSHSTCSVCQNNLYKQMTIP